MVEIQGDTVIVDAKTTRLEAFRMEDIAKAPTIILFIDNNEPQLVPLKEGMPAPVLVKSHNSQAEVQIIGVGEIQAAMAAGSIES